MKTFDEKELRKSLARALSKEIGKQIDRHVDSCDPEARAVAERLSQKEAERWLGCHDSTDAPSPANVDKPLVFRAPVSEKPFHISVDGMGNALRDTLRGTQPSDAISKNVQIKMEWITRF